MDTERHHYDFIDENGEFNIISGAGHSLRASLQLNCPESREIAVLCHGVFSNRNIPLLRKLSERLECNCVRFDFHGCGDSEGVDSWTFSGYENEVKHDIRSVVQFLRNKHLKVITLIGHSRGGNDVLMYSLMFDDVPLIVSLAARYNLKEGLEKYVEGREKELEENGYVLHTSSGDIPRKITRNDLDLRKQIDMSEVKKCRNTKFLLIHGSSDVVVPFADVDKFESDLRHDEASGVESDRVDVLRIPGASHAFVFNSQHFKKVVKRINAAICLESIRS